MVHRALAESICHFEAGLEACKRPEDRALVQRYLAALAPILGAAVLGRDILQRLQPVERLFGNSWLIDQAPFESAFAKWREFRCEYEAFASRGMTINERLHAFSLSEAYDHAVSTGDRDAVRTILKKVYVDDDAISRIIGRLDSDA
jgi:hypothetical protein